MTSDVRTCPGPVLLPCWPSESASSILSHITLVSSTECHNAFATSWFEPLPHRFRSQFPCPAEGLFWSMEGEGWEILSLDARIWRWSGRWVDKGALGGAGLPAVVFAFSSRLCLSLHVVAPLTPVCEAVWAIMVQICS